MGQAGPCGEGPPPGDMKEAAQHRSPRPPPAWMGPAIHTRCGQGGRFPRVCRGRGWAAQEENSHCSHFRVSREKGVTRGTKKGQERVLGFFLHVK